MQLLRKVVALTLSAATAYVVGSVLVPPPERMQVGLMYDNRVLVTTNQVLQPAGRRIQFPGRPLDVAVSPDGNLLAVLLVGSVRMYSTSGEFIRSVAVTPSNGGIAFQPDGARLWVSEVYGTVPHRITAVGVAGSSSRSIDCPAKSGPAGIAIDDAGRFAYVALNLTNQLARIDLESGAIATTPVGIAPLNVALAVDGRRVFVTNQGGFRPAPGEVTAPSAGTPILIDSRGSARSGSLSVVDVASFRAIAELPTGLLPSGVRVSPDGSLVAVANSNGDSVSFFRTDSLTPDATVPLAAEPGGAGSGPTAVAFSLDGDRLYVTCSGNNSVAVLRRSRVGTARRPESHRLQYSVEGAFPTDWHPTSLAIGRDGAVYVANLKGIGTRNATARFTINNWMGTINVLTPSGIDAALNAPPSDANNPFRNAVTPSGSPANLRSLGIQHVFLIIKENRTYDQVLGDLGTGNGDPSLTLYGAPITPNHHALATQFVLLDNFFASGTVSADGHQWLTQSIVTPYLERSHGTYPRSYPYSGEDPLALSPTGFLWTNAQEHGLSARVYGEYVQATNNYSGRWNDYLQDAAGPMQLSTRSSSPIAALNPLVEHEYPAFAMNIPDTFRARKFLDRFREFEASASLPNLVIIQLPADHTVGVGAGLPTPNAMMADNDLALGRIVEAISKSSYWPKSAIFVTEDDAQDGVDHVDGHRTICFVISPYTRRGAVDSTHYNHTSVMRTIEDLLGLPPMTKFDAAALPMRSAFTTTPDFSPYQALSNTVPLHQLTAPLDRLSGQERRAAIASAAMDFSTPDAAPEEELNRILWHSVRGWTRAYPRVPHRPDCPPDEH